MIIKANSLYMPLKDKSVQAIITSPPYWGLRNYDIPDIVFSDSWVGQLGQEPTIKQFMEHLMLVMAECWRVLKDEGVCFVNLGDTYNSNNGFNRATNTYKRKGRDRGSSEKRGEKQLPAKTLCFIPERFALACLDSGWIIRNKIIWYKPNSMPTSAKDRFSVKYEQVFMMVKQRKYYFDLIAVREKPKKSSIERLQRAVSNKNKWVNGHNGNPHNLSQLRPQRKMDKNKDRPSLHRNYKNDPEQKCAISNYQFENGDYLVAAFHSKGVNPGDVWEISTQGYSGAHFATFPPKLVERMLLCSTKIGDYVLDPFGGAGTTGMVALEYRRKPVLLDIGYQQLQKERLNNVEQQKLF